MSTEVCLIIGAGHAGTSLAFQLRREGWLGEIKLLSNEKELPYHRPPLSKELLAGEKTLADIQLRPEKMYGDNDIDLLLDCEVESVDTNVQKIRLSDGREFAYNKLALCTGSSARLLPLGNGQEKGNGEDNIYTVRQAADILAMKKSLESGEVENAVIIGAGYIGLEAAAILRGMGVSVTVLEAADRVLQRVTSSRMSDFIAALHRAEGVKLVTRAMVEKFVANASGDAVAQVVCADGTSYPAQLVIVGVGAMPVTNLSGSNIHVDNGIVVDDHCQTSVANVYAAGDCTSHPSALYKRQLRLESVQNANDQARVAAANICGKSQSYDVAPWFWSDQYQVKLQMVGLNSGYDNVVARGLADDLDLTDAQQLQNLVEKGFALFYFCGDKLLAVDAVNRPKEFMVAKQLLKLSGSVDKVRLADESLEAKELLGN